MLIKLPEQIAEVRLDFKDFGTNKSLHGTLRHVVTPPLQDAELRPLPVVIAVKRPTEHFVVFLYQRIEPLGLGKVLCMHVLVPVEVPLMVRSVLASGQRITTTP